MFSALFSAWITVKLSLPKFRQERLWDRKAVAYERIIEAFHKSKMFSSEHLNAKFQNSDVVEDRDNELCRLYSEAREEISRATDIGSFTLSARALELLAEYQKESRYDDSDPNPSWLDVLQFENSVTDKYLNLLIAEAKRDLGYDA